MISIYNVSNKTADCVKIAILSAAKNFKQFKVQIFYFVQTGNKVGKMFFHVV